MLAGKPAGRNAAALKYDLLTALGAYALSQGKGPQRLVLRLMTLITARYNWTRDELYIGQREIAKLWGVDERTVKREMAKLRGMGWLVVKRQGRRGRVTEYGLDTALILKTTRPVWPAIGPDFELRLGGDDPSEESGGDGKVVPFRGATPAQEAMPPPDLGAGDEWSLTRAVLQSEDPGLYRAWLHALRREGRDGGRLRLIAPSRFHASYVTTHLVSRLLRACQSIDPDVSEIVIAY